MVKRWAAGFQNDEQIYECIDLLRSAEGGLFANFKIELLPSSKEECKKLP